MKKIVLIEDRHKRQELFTQELNFNFEQYVDVLDNVILDDFYTLADEIIHDSFNLSEYDIIVCHKSVQLEENADSNSIITSKLREYCKTHHKIFVFFSGGISANFYDNSELELLEINSKTFYSKNLTLFLDAVKNGNENILMLCYGERWKQNIVANILEKTNLFLFDVQYGKSPSEFQIVDDLSKIDFKFYEIKEKSFEEIEKFKESLELYFLTQITQDTKNKSLLIHHDNICTFELFDEIEKFNANEDIDKYISEKIIELKQKDFEIFFIKDNLSSNYLELLGLRVAYHIRLSLELGDKRFAPIVIVSDFSIEQLCKFDEMANILFTSNVYLCKNTKEDIEKFQQLELHNLTLEEYNQDFLSKIKVNPPKDYLSHHSIANEWAIYRWAEFLKVETDVIKSNKAKIDNMLYFKYLKAKYATAEQESAKIVKPTKKGKVLLIDDEWNKGWSDILNAALSNDGLEFKTFEYEYKDKSEYNLLIAQLQHKELKTLIAQADVIILDLRLLQSDHENEDIEDYAGIKILQRIHEINAGIQVIMLTATSKSTVLEKLYEKKILGYIKKEHPDDNSINTIENINKLVGLVDRGLERKFLKSIYLTSINILSILDNDIFEKYEIPFEKYEPYWKKIIVETEAIFDILDSDRNNKFLYAIVSIAVSVESILSIFIPNDREMFFWDGEKYECLHNALWCRIQKLFQKLACNDNFDTYELIDKRNRYMHKKPVKVTSKEITKWFEMLNKMIIMVQNPPNLRVYDKNDITNNLQNIFNNS